MQQQVFRTTHAHGGGGDPNGYGGRRGRRGSYKNRRGGSDSDSGSSDDGDGEGYARLGAKKDGESPSRTPLEVALSGAPGPSPRRGVETAGGGGPSRFGPDGAGRAGEISNPVADYLNNTGRGSLRGSREDFSAPKVAGGGSSGGIRPPGEQVAVINDYGVGRRRSIGEKVLNAAVPWRFGGVSLKKGSPAAGGSTRGEEPPPQRAQRSGSIVGGRPDGRGGIDVVLIDDEDMFNRDNKVKDPFWLNPRSQFFRTWDVVIALLLLYTAIFTPVEVSFFESKLNGLFIMNRCVDGCFIIDMVFNFMIPIQSTNGVWITEPKTIAHTYLMSWFPIDFVSVLPFDLVGVLSGSESTTNLKIIRIVRLFRLAKLLRLLRGGRMFQRWESTMAVNYAKISLAKFVVITLAIAHWLACAWHIVIEMEGSTKFAERCGDLDSQILNWVNEYAYLDMDSSRWAKYLTSLYWAVATLSTLGYGDVVPTTDGERLFVVISALIGASVYAYMVGNVCGIIQGMDEANSTYFNKMDTLNAFMEEKCMPQELRVRLRDFFRFRRHNNTLHRWHELQRDMSPSLIREVSKHLHADQISNVRCFQRCGRDFVTAVATSLDTETYSSLEEIVGKGDKPNRMWIMERGVVASTDSVMHLESGGRIITNGGTFGEDMMFTTHKREYTVVTFTNSVLLRLNKRKLYDIVPDFPDAEMDIRRYVVRMLMRRAVMAYTRILMRLYDPTRNDLDDQDVMVLHMVHKETVEYLCKVKPCIARVVRSTKLIQRCARAFLQNSGRGRERRKAQQDQQDWDGLVELLSIAGFPEYTELMSRHRMTLSRMEDLSADSLCIMGVPMGPAVEILRAFKVDYKKLQVKKARQQPTLRSLTLVTPKTPHGGPNVMGWPTVDELREAQQDRDD